MKNIVVLLAVLVSFSFGQSIYKKVDDATNSGVTEGSAVVEENRPAAFIIKHAKDEVVFNEAGKVLDENGNIKLIRLDVKFDFDKYDIKDEYQGEISEAAKFLKKHKTLTSTIEGHTDSKGTHEYNHNLSQLRAKKVALALASMGINEDRIITKGFGETVPVASNESEEGRAQNRRVDISFNK
ncbi:MAG TPA: OmpA family protein [Sulfurospirillum arcachonense]|nr:OmpA family protein [Sulfurospirillum arcachonense]